MVYIIAAKQSVRERVAARQRSRLDGNGITGSSDLPRMARASFGVTTGLPRGKKVD
jgi:hypothetical protein